MNSFNFLWTEIIWCVWTWIVIVQRIIKVPKCVPWKNLIAWISIMKFIFFSLWKLKQKDPKESVPPNKRGLPNDFSWFWSVDQFWVAAMRECSKTQPTLISPLFVGTDRVWSPWSCPTGYLLCTSWACDWNECRCRRWRGAGRYAPNEDA